LPDVQAGHLGWVRRRGRVQVQHLRDQGSQARSGQPLQPQMPYAALAAPPGQGRRRQMRRIHLAVPVGSYQQQALDRFLA